MNLQYELLQSGLEAALGKMKVEPVLTQIIRGAEVQVSMEKYLH